ncbi:NAC domain-containing protein 12-like [Heracleum sosnowskyi]|uniref:NAC domain-containing protein 12-like n=1 Tax=Heracleum sosnowskyi TaxID=360622 RepID=A0AAD8IB11_9APIA|nr:NAC domain-containing protein 12-like [Heracleum sosnowskyi]
MGNCLFGGLGDNENEVIKVITSSGGIMEFYEPTTAESITDEFPGHVIFKSHDLFWNPISHNEMLLAAYSAARGPAGSGGMRQCKQSNKSNSNKYMSTSGVWKVKLVISPEQLAEILSQEVRTEELIESIRTVAKCGNNYKNCLSSSSESSAFSDLWRLSAVSTANPRH